MNEMLIKTYNKLYSGTIYLREILPMEIENIKKLESSFPKDITNSCLIFLLNQTQDNVIKTAILNLHEMSLIYSSALNTETFRKNPQYKKLDTLRNKLVAHRHQSELASSRNWYEWYSSEFNTLEKLLDFILEYSLFLNELIFKFFEENVIQPLPQIVKEQAVILDQDIDEIRNAILSFQMNQVKAKVEVL
jgi:hypothetical protein